MTSETVTDKEGSESAPQASTETTTPNPVDLKDGPTNNGGTYKEAYLGLQTSSNRVREAGERREAELLRQNSVLADALTYVKESQKAITKATLGEDAANDLDAKLSKDSETRQAQQAIATLRSFTEKQQAQMLRTAKTLGIDAELDFANDAKSLDEWESRVTASWDRALALVPQKYVKAVEAAKANAEKDVAKKAEEMTDKKLREAGVDKVDLGKGAPPRALGQRIAEMDPNSKEFKELVEQAKQGKLVIPAPR